MRSALALTMSLSGLLLAACQGDAAPQDEPAPTDAASPETVVGRADVGGYELGYSCVGDGSPTVVMEAGLGASGLDTWDEIQAELGGFTRMCTYDRAHLGVSDDRPDGVKLTGDLQSQELHALLEAIDAGPPYVVVAHSYGGMPARLFAARYPGETAGLILLDVSNEWEVPIYKRLYAGGWFDGDARIDIHATVDELKGARDFGDTPMVVVTSEVIEDEWLKTVPQEAAAAQAHLPTFSSDSVYIVALDTGHFIPDENPDLVIRAIREIVEASRAGVPLAACEETFAAVGGACVTPGDVPKLRPAA